MFAPARSKRVGSVLALGIGLLLLALAGCSSSAGSSTTVPVVQASTPTATAPVPSPTVSPTVAGGTSCQTTQLTLSKQSDESGLSNFAIIYRLQNTSQQVCTLNGYPGVQLLDASQQPMTITVNQQTSAYFYNNQYPQLVTLAAGASGYFILEWTAAANGCPGAAFVLVTPPGDQANLRIANAIEVCTGNVVVSPIEPTAFTS